ncbi:MAG TPA: chemotaxis protein CheB [Pyrinomonadaceae bacterium]|jgi:two-component system chemotaxis response regulator CheB
MAKRDIIVIGASAGGYEALKILVSGLPANLPASVFVVWHMAPEIRESVLPYALQKAGKLPAKQAVDGEAIKTGQIYVAPPDFHLLLETDRIRVTKGPKENRFRPAVDPLFRSAAYNFGSRVVGVVLSGALDDGTAGLWTIKYRGGTAIVQDPLDAEFPSMPKSAMREVKVDFCEPVEEIAGILARLVNESAGENIQIDMNENEKVKIEIGIAAEDGAYERGVFNLGDLSPFTCPDCHGVLLKLKDGKLVRFRCHTGHAFSADSLLTTLTENVEDSIWNAVRAMEENMMLLKHLGNHLAETGQKELSESYFIKAQEAENRIDIMRQAAMRHEKLNTEKILQESATE